MGAYRTIFEVSYLANGTLLTSLAFLAIGIAVCGVAVWLRKERAGFGALFAGFIGLAFTSFSLFWIHLNITDSQRFVAALKQGHCQIAEGTVEVLHMEPAEGHDPGDKIRVGGRDFQFSYFKSTVVYNQTISHGGVLMQGARARLHYLGDDILEVEIAQ